MWDYLSTSTTASPDNQIQRSMQKAPEIASAASSPCTTLLPEGGLGILRIGEFHEEEPRDPKHIPDTRAFYEPLLERCIGPEAVAMQTRMRDEMAPHLVGNGRLLACIASCNGDEAAAAKAGAMLTSASEREKQEFHCAFLRHAEEIFSCKDTTIPNNIFADSFQPGVLTIPQRMAVAMAKLDCSRAMNGKNVPSLLAEGTFRSIRYAFQNPNGEGPLEFEVQNAKPPHLLLLNCAPDATNAVPVFSREELVQAAMEDFVKAAEDAKKVPRTAAGDSTVVFRGVECSTDKLDYLRYGKTVYIPVHECDEEDSFVCEAFTATGKMDPDLSDAEEGDRMWFELLDKVPHCTVKLTVFWHHSLGTQFCVDALDKNGHEDSSGCMAMAYSISVYFHPLPSTDGGATKRKKRGDADLPSDDDCAAEAKRSRRECEEQED